eukprot:TRINITY_DN62972_c0_g1_i1.p1 TRINITY_DN62972_c0_g1~~TRINITY_DN62972_c0_g1_i1.p1  ORF type:complete len:788 (+),score=86.88 TRINITY_DN62972_c0_g1_i1:45-2408(+)
MANDNDPEFDEKWDTFEEIFGKVADIASAHRVIQTNISTIMMRAYNIVYTLIRANPKHATRIYNKSQKLLEGYLTTLMSRTLTDRSTQLLLRQCAELWDQYDIVSRCCHHMLKYVNQHLEHFEVENTSNSVPKMLVQCFRTTVYDTVKDNLRKVMFHEIDQEREGCQAERATLKQITNMIVTMGAGALDVYEQDFERPYLDMTQQHYGQLAQAWLQGEGVDLYMRNSERWLNHERNFSMAVLHPSSVEKVDSCLNKEMLEKYYITVVDDGIGGAKALLSAWNPPRLGRMYRLLRRISGTGWNGLDPMAEEVQKYILREGNQINLSFSTEEAAGGSSSTTPSSSSNQAPTDTQTQEPPPKRRCTTSFGGNREREADYIRDAIELHDKYTQLFENEFDNHKVFHGALRRAFETFFNADLPVPGTDQTTNGAELLSNYCDTLMSRKKVESGLEHQQLNKLVMLFTYLSEKDTFREFYHKAMARRLLGRSSDFNVERDMITLLKAKMQGGFVKKLEDMLQDRRVADEAGDKFKAWVKENSTKKATDFSVFVLTRGSWPKLHLLELKPPSELADCMELFTKYYTNLHEKRTLIWVHSYGKATLQVKYPKVAKPLTVNCNTMQACILLLFNHRDSWTLNQLAEELGQPNNSIAEVRSAAVPLLFSKHRLLAKPSSGKEINPANDPLTVNEKFESQQLNIHMPTAKTTDRKEVQKQVEENRKYIIDCYLVKIGKSTKQTTRLEMETKCIHALSTLFQPDPSQIRTRIESLIQREFLSLVIGEDGEPTDKIQYST